MVLMGGEIRFMNGENIGIEIIHNFVNDKEYVQYHYNKYIDIIYEELYFLYYEELNVLKSKIELLKEVTVIDYNSINTIFKIAINFKEEYCIENFLITLIVPTKNYRKDTIIKSILLDNNNYFEDNINKVLEEIINEAESTLVDKLNLYKYRYLIINEEFANIILAMIAQYLNENPEKLNLFKSYPENKVLIEVVNKDDYSIGKINLLNDYYSNSYIFKKIINISGQRNLTDYCNEFIFLDKIYNYGTLINFYSGKINMVMLTKDVNNNIFKIKYDTSIDEILTNFYTSKKFYNSIIIKLDKENINDFY